MRRLTWAHSWWPTGEALNLTPVSSLQTCEWFGNMCAYINNFPNNFWQSATHCKWRMYGPLLRSEFKFPMQNLTLNKPSVDMPQNQLTNKYLNTGMPHWLIKKNWVSERFGKLFFYDCLGSCSKNAVTHVCCSVSTNLSIELPMSRKK